MTSPTVQKYDVDILSLQCKYTENGLQSGVRDNLVSKLNIYSGIFNLVGIGCHIKDINAVIVLPANVCYNTDVEGIFNLNMFKAEKENPTTKLHSSF